VSKIGQLRQPEESRLLAILADSGDQAVHEAELARLLERVPERLMTKALADPLHTEIGTLKGLARLVGPAGIAQKLPERELGSPVLDGVSDRRGQLQRCAQMLFGAIPIPLRALELAGQAPALYQVLA
jgi:hypothetical protein